MWESFRMFDSRVFKHLISVLLYVILLYLRLIVVKYLHFVLYMFPAVLLPTSSLIDGVFGNPLYIDVSLKLPNERQNEP